MSSSSKSNKRNDADNKNDKNNEDMLDMQTQENKVAEENAIEPMSIDDTNGKNEQLSMKQRGDTGYSNSVLRAASSNEVKSYERDNKNVGFDSSVTVAITESILPIKNVDFNTYNEVPLDSLTLNADYLMKNDSLPLNTFSVLKNIPQMFKFKTVYNTKQIPNPEDIYLNRAAFSDTIDAVSSSIEHFNNTTMVTRLALNERIDGEDILDPNEYKGGEDMVSKLIYSPTYNINDEMNYTFKRTKALISMFIALNRKLVSFQKLLQPIKTNGASYSDTILTEQIYHEGMAPHFYMSSFGRISQWTRTAIDKLIKDYKVEFGKYGSTNINGIELKYSLKTVIDQWTAAIINLNNNQLSNHLTNFNDLTNQLNACTLDGDRYYVDTRSDALTLLYKPDLREYDLMMYRLLSSKDVKETVITNLINIVDDTNRFFNERITDVWTIEPATSAQLTSFQSYWSSIINVGSKETSAKMLVYETFAEFFNFKMNPVEKRIGLYNLSTILGIYSFMIQYPRISQTIMHHLGYALHRAYADFLPSAYAQFVSEQGVYTSEFGKHIHQDERIISRAECQNGLQYSILTFSTASSGKNSRTNTRSKFKNSIIKINTSLQPVTTQIELTRKRDAGFPYMWDNYQVIPSWERCVYGGRKLSSAPTRMSTQFKSILNELGQLLNSSESDNISSNLPKDSKKSLADWMTKLRDIAQEIDLPYSYTMGRIQEALFNSPLFVGSMYDPSLSQWVYVRKDLGMVNLKDKTKKSVSKVSYIDVPSFNIFVGLKQLITLQGEIPRNNLVTKYHDRNNNPYHISKENVRVLSGKKILSLANGILTNGRNYGYAMQFCIWAAKPDLSNNPIKEIAEYISKYFRNTIYTGFIKQVFSLFNVSYDDSFIDTLNDALVQKKYLSSGLALMNPIDDSYNLDDQPSGSFISRDLNLISDVDIEKFRILAIPLLSNKSRINRIVRGWTIGKMYVEHLNPTQTSLSNNWTHTWDIKDITFNTDERSNGRVQVIRWTSPQSESETDASTRDPNTIIHVLPYSASNKTRPLIRMKYFSEIPPEYKVLLAEAVADGTVFVEATNQLVDVTVTDIPELNLDVPFSKDGPLNKDTIYTYLQSTAGAIWAKDFNNTKFATNFNSNNILRPGYIQWIATTSDTDESIYASMLTETSTRLAGSIIPDGKSLEFGKSNGACFSTGEIKTDSKIVNFNNMIPVISENLLGDISVSIQPRTLDELYVYANGDD